jgi:dephospho-CoA kinase
MMYKIGLTGGICTGKTFVLNLLEELGCYTVRADDIAREIIFSADSPVLQTIKEKFGEDIYDEKQGINKETFTRILFEDAEKRDFINKIVHPLVTAEREKKFKDIGETGLYTFFVYESALMVEATTYKDFEKIIVVYVSQEEQMKRLMARDQISQEEAEKKIKAQFPLSEKLKVAHYTIDTTGSFDSARAKTLETFYLMKKDFNIE